MMFSTIVDKYQNGSWFVIGSFPCLRTFKDTTFVTGRMQENCFNSSTRLDFLTNVHSNSLHSLCTAIYLS